ncbi:MAG: sulfatase [Candidatus Binatia bacterium]
MSDRLNVLVIVIECARADHLSCYGYPRETTPFLDHVAREGVRFTHAIAAAPWTLPAHASLLTGLYPVTHGATDENRFLASRHQTLAEHLKAAGYRTAAFCTNPWVSPETGFGRGFDAFFTQRHHNRVTARALFYGRRASDRLLRRSDAGARRTNQALAKWLAAGAQPFFAFVHYNEAHLPYAPPRPYDRLFMPKRVSGGRVRAVNQDGNRYVTGQVDMTAEDIAILSALYDGELRYADHRLAELAELLRARNEWDRTLCLVTAGHGESLGEHGMIGHAFGLRDTLLRVPLLLRCPARVPQGFVVDELVQTTDILPTILGVLNLPADGIPMHGRSLLDAGRVTPGPAFAISERYRPHVAALRRRFPEFDTRPVDVRQKAIRTKREKFIWHSDEANEYYDLVADPGETTNSIESASERADALRRQLFNWLATVEKFESEEPEPALDGLMRRQLQGLGYID